MRARIVRLHSPDAELSDPGLVLDPELQTLFVQMMIAPVPGRSDAEESIDLEVSTPAHLGRLLEAGRPVQGRHHLIVDRVVLAEVRAFLERVVAAVDAESYDEIGLSLGRIGRWEFEDYVDHGMTAPAPRVRGHLLRLVERQSGPGRAAVSMLVGSVGDVDLGTEPRWFDLDVVTVDALARQVRSDGPLPGYAHLVVDRIDLTPIRAFLAEEVSSQAAPTWAELVLRIERLARPATEAPPAS